MSGRARIAAHLTKRNQRVVGSMSKKPPSRPHLRREGPALSDQVLPTFKQHLTRQGTSYGLQAS
eukprot:6213976-Pleurochrysis_carterae.AAC.1